MRDDVYSPWGPDWKFSWPPVWSADGSTIAWRLTSRSSPRECVARDDRRGEEFDRVGAPAVSGDGTRLAYRAHRGDRAFLVIDGMRGPEFDFISDPAVSADGSVVAYAAKADGRWRILAGGREIPVDGPPTHLFLSRDGRSVGWLREEGAGGVAKVRVVVNGKAGEPFTLVGRPVFDMEGRLAAYAADDGSRQYVVIGETKVPVEGRLTDPVFSPDGRKIGYGARLHRGLWWKVLDVP